MMGAGQGADAFADPDESPAARPKARGHCQKRTRRATLEIADKTDVFASVARAAERIRRFVQSSPLKEGGQECCHFRVWKYRKSGGTWSFRAGGRASQK
jgi:hypothetical protein